MVKPKRKIGQRFRQGLRKVYHWFSPKRTTTSPNVHTSESQQPSRPPQPLPTGGQSVPPPPELLLDNENTSGLLGLPTSYLGSPTSYLGSLAGRQEPSAATTAEVYQEHVHTTPSIRTSSESQESNRIPQPLPIREESASTPPEQLPAQNGPFALHPPGSSETQNPILSPQSLPTEGNSVSTVSELFTQSNITSGFLGQPTDVASPIERQDPNTTPTNPPTAQTPGQTSRAGNTSSSANVTVVATSSQAVPRITAPSPTLSPQTSSGSIKTSLWLKAFQELSVDDKAILPPSGNLTPSDLLDDIKNKADQCAQNGWTVKFRANKILVRNVVDKLLRWVDKFKQIGDIAMQYDPVHAALPWAGIRFILQISLSDMETQGIIIAGIEKVARLVVRSAVYDKLYLGPESNVSASIRTGLVNGLLDLYIAILRFLAGTLRYLARPIAARILHSIVDLEGARSLYETIEEKELLLEMELRTAERESQDNHLVIIKGKSHNTEELLEELSIAFVLFFDGFQKSVQDGKRHKILKWLSKIEFIKHHRTAQEDLLENSGNWLLKEERFREWRSSRNSGIFWLHGIPGSGKTKLTCVVIDFLKSLPQSDGPVVYFYCKRDDSRRRNPESIAQALLKQLCVAFGDLPNLIVQEYAEREKEGLAAGSLGFKECKNLIISLLNSYSHTSIIIDALDESDPDERWRLLELFENIISTATSPVKIFVSSRDDSDIQLRLEKVPNRSINAQDNTEDINRFILREVTEATKHQRLLYGTVQDILRDRIICTIAEGSNGMFQWADLQIKNLYRLKSPREIEENLGKLPKTLEATYSRMWQDILQSATERQRRITEKSLMWLMCSLTPLDRNRWAEFTYWPDEATPQDGDALLDLCRNLVKWDRQFDHVIFAHLSVQEYFETHVFTTGKVNIMAAETCLSLLARPEGLPHAHTAANIRSPPKTSDFNFAGSRPSHLSDNLPLPSSSSSRPRRRLSLSSFLNTPHDETNSRPVPGTVQDHLTFFATYSVEHWTDHVDLSYNYEEPMDIGLRDLLLRFFGTLSKPSQAYSRWFDAAQSLPYSWHPKGLEYLKSEPLNPLFAMSYFRFGEELLPQQEFDGIDMDIKNSQGQTLLFLASMEGNERLVDFLLEKRAKDDVRALIDLNCDFPNSFTSPLAAAITNGHIGAIVKLLNKAAITANDNQYANILKAAARLGPRAVIEKIMSMGIELEITESVLIEAASNDNGGPVMEFLLSLYPDTVISEAVLIAASTNYKHGPNLMHLFISEYPSISITEAVIAEAARTSSRTLDLLLSRDPDITITERILLAALGKGLEVLELLLPKCSDITVTEAVIVAAVGSDFETLETLLSRYPDIVITKAVMVAAVSKDLEVVRLLLSRYEEIEVTEEVMVAAVKNGLEVMDLLLSKCPDTTITEAVVVTAAAATGWKTLEKLLSKYSDIVITEAVIISATSNVPEVVELLLSRCSDTTITEAAMVAVIEETVRDTWVGARVANLLISRCSPLVITEAVMIAALGNFRNEEVILLLSKCPELSITEKVILAAVEHDLEVVKLILTKCPDFSITEAVMLAAARNLEVVKLILPKCPEHSITEDVMSVAVRNSLEVVKLILPKCPELSITEDVMSAAVMNGLEVVKLILTKCPDFPITEAVMLAAVEDDLEVVKLILPKCPELSITKDVMSAAVENDLEVVKLILPKCPNFSITEKVMLAAVEDDLEMAKLILTKCPDFPITEAVMLAAARNDLEVVKLILPKCPEHSITEDVMSVAVMNGPEVVKLILPKCPELSITEDVMSAAVMRGLEVVKLILTKFPDFPITEAVMLVAARDLEVVKLILLKCPEHSITEAVMLAASRYSLEGMKLITSKLPNLEITEAVVVAAAGVKYGDLEFLLSKRPEIEITEAVLIAAARGGNSEILRLLLSQYPEIEITEAVLIAAAACVLYGNLKFLLSKHPDIEITEAVVVAAAGGGYDTLRFLLSKYPDIEITEAVVVAAAGRNLDNLNFLLSKYPDIEITEAAVVAAAGVQYGGLEFLLSQRPDIEITEAVVVAAAGGGYDHWKFLLSKRPDIEITEAVVVAAAGGDYGTLGFLLSKHPDIEITEAVVVAAAGGDYGTLGFLLSKHPEIEITEAVVVAAAGGYYGTLGFLLSKHPDIEITEAVVVAAAAGGDYCGHYGTLGFLLSKHPDIEITEAAVVAAAGGYYGTLGFLLSMHPEIEITEAVVVAAAGGYYGTLGFLLSKHLDIEITEAVVVAAAGGDYGTLGFLLSKHPDIEIAEAVVVTAAGGDYGTLGFLLSMHPEIEITEAVVVAAAGGYYGTLGFLLSKHPDIEITEAVVVAAAGNVPKALGLLLSKSPDLELTEAVAVAAARNAIDGYAVTRLILDRNPDIEITQAFVAAAKNNISAGRRILDLIKRTRGTIPAVRDPAPSEDSRITEDDS